MTLTRLHNFASEEHTLPDNAIVKAGKIRFVVGMIRQMIRQMMSAPVGTKFEIIGQSEDGPTLKTHEPPKKGG